MGESARAAAFEFLTCERCGGNRRIEREDEGQMRLRCGACGGTPNNASWTLIDPSGRVHAFASWDELARSAPKSGISAIHEKVAAHESDSPGESRKAVSASALLDITPTPSAAKLEIADSDVIGPTSEAMPVSESQFIAADVEPPAVSEARPVDWHDDEAELLSVRDIQLVKQTSQGEIPVPPAAGHLKTLPPERPDAPPPPSISVEETPPPPETKTAAPVASPVADAREESGGGWALPSMGMAAAAAAVVWWIASPSSPPPAATSESNAPPAIAAAAPQPAIAPAPLVPNFGAAPAEPATATSEAASTAAAKTEAPTPAPPSAVEPAPTENAGERSVRAEPTEKTSAATEPTKKAIESLSGPELLERAGAARRQGEYGQARELYARVLAENPSNVEAHGGLGEIARAQGDLRAAKASFETALAVSPLYGPAVLGLADTDWDLGDRASAQARYAEIVRRLGPSAPERAKQRGTPPSAQPATSVAASSDEP